MPFQSVGSDIELAHQVAEYFKLDKSKAEKIIKDFKNIVSNWKIIANCYNIPKAEQQIMGKAFRVQAIALNR